MTRNKYVLIISIYLFKGGDIVTQADNSNRYNKLNTTTLCIRLNRKTDTDIIERLKAVQSKQGYVKRLIRQDIREEQEYDEWFKGGDT